MKRKLMTSSIRRKNLGRLANPAACSNLQRELDVKATLLPHSIRLLRGCACAFERGFKRGPGTHCVRPIDRLNAYGSAYLPIHIGEGDLILPHHPL